MFLKLALLLSVEMFVLVAAVFLLVYITKSQVNKWFTYGAVGIIISLLMMMTCSTFGAICMKHCSRNKEQKECRFEDNNNEKGMMFKHGHRECSEEMMQEDGKCEHSMKDCEMKQEDCMRKSGCKGMEGKSIYKEVIITNEEKN